MPGRSPAGWKVLLGTGAGMFLGLVLVVGLFAKMGDPHAFTQVIERQGLDFLLQGRAVMFIGLGIEALLGFALLLGVRRSWVLWSSVALVLFFLFLTGRHYYLHAHGLAAADESCGCFGDLVQRTPGEAFWQDLLLLFPALLLAFVGRPSASAPFPGLRLALAGGLTTAALIYAAGVPKPPPALRDGAPIAEICVGEGTVEEGRLCLNAVLPELAEGDHAVVLVDLDDADFLSRMDALAEYTDAMAGPTLWVLCPAGDERLDEFAFEHQPNFSLIAAPRSLVDAMSERRPRSFRVRDGAVTVSWENWPPFEDLVSEGSRSDDEAGGPGDTGSEDDGPDDDGSDDDGSGGD